jgi:hypothetical protein
MKFKLLTLMLSICLFTVAKGQVDDIKRKSEEHKKKREQSSGNRNNSSKKDDNARNNNKSRNETTNEFTDDLFDGCFDGCFEGFFEGLCSSSDNNVQSTPKVYKPPVYPKDTTPKLPPKPGYFDIMPSIAFNPDRKYWNSDFRLNFGKGMLTSDLRFSRVSENGDNGKSSFETIHWQVLQLNFSRRPRFDFKLGSGVYWDRYSDMAFNEHSLGMNAKFIDNKLGVDLEFRSAIDYKFMEEVFGEINFKTTYQILNSKVIDIHTVFGVLIQRYYYSVGLTSIQGGLLFHFH